MVQLAFNHPHAVVPAQEKGPVEYLDLAHFVPVHGPQSSNVLILLGG